MGEGPKSGGPKGWGAQNFALFFLSPGGNFILCSLSGMSSRGIWVAFVAPGRSNARLEFSCCHVKPRRLWGHSSPCVSCSLLSVTLHLERFSCMSRWKQTRRRMVDDEAQEERRKDKGRKEESKKRSPGRVGSVDQGTTSKVREMAFNPDCKSCVKVARPG